MVSDLEGMVHLWSVIFGYGLYPQPYPAFWWFISALPVQTRHHKEKIKSTKKRTTVSKAPQKQQAANLGPKASAEKTKSQTNTKVRKKKKNRLIEYINRQKRPSSGTKLTRKRKILSQWWAAYLFHFVLLFLLLLVVREIYTVDEKHNACTKHAKKTKKYI